MPWMHPRSRIESGRDPWADAKSGRATEVEPEPLPAPMPYLAIAEAAAEEARRAYWANVERVREVKRVARARRDARRLGILK